MRGLLLGNRRGGGPVNSVLLVRCKRNGSALRAAPTGAVMLYMIVEHFKNADPIPVYRRFRECGRLAPDGLQYISSLVDDRLERCFQIMETVDRRLLDQRLGRREAALRPQQL